MTMTTCHDGTVCTLPAESIDTTGGACTVAANLLTTGIWGDSLPHTIYPDSYPTVGPEHHHHHHYPWYPQTMDLLTGVSSTPGRTSAQKPHEGVARALREIAPATRALQGGSQAMGVPAAQH